MNIRKELEKFIDTRPFDDKQLCEMWKKWDSRVEDDAKPSFTSVCSWMYQDNSCIFVCKCSR